MFVYATPQMQVSSRVSCLALAPVHLFWEASTIKPSRAEEGDGRFIARAVLHFLLFPTARVLQGRPLLHSSSPFWLSTVGERRRIEEKRGMETVLFFLMKKGLDKKEKQQEEFFEGRLVPVAFRIKRRRVDRERGNGGREISATLNT